MRAIVAGFYHLISKKLNIPIKWKISVPSVLGPRKMEQQQCDLISAVVSDSDMEQHNFNLTSPYIEYPLVIATDDRALFVDSLDNISDKRVGIEKSASFYNLLNRDIRISILNGSNASSRSSRCSERGAVRGD